eukprot:1721921-Amphidinium_carterae.3
MPATQDYTSQGALTVPYVEIPDTQPVTQTKNAWMPWKEALIRCEACSSSSFSSKAMPHRLQHLDKPAPPQI